MNYLLRGKIILAFLLFCAFSLSAQTTFINEVDYSGADPFLEIVSPTSQDRSGWSVTLYDEDGFPYDTIDIGLLTPTSTSGTSDIIVVDVILFTDPGAASVQDAGFVVQHAVSWGNEEINSAGEGGVDPGNAQEGPLFDAEVTPEYIAFQAPVGSSLQLTGTGTEYADFGWNAIAPTMGEINGGLTDSGPILQSFIGETFENVLPVELLFFEAQLNDRNIDIRWATAAEHNSFYFVLERSVNGAAFTEVNRTEAAGFSEQRLDYRYTDTAPPGGVLYYRLKQVDFDGTMTTYDVVVVTNENDKAEPVVYPNPVGEQLQIAFPEPLEDIRVEIFEITSRRLVYTQKIDQTGYQLTMNCGHLEAGQYLVRLSAPRYLVERRFVKLTK